MASFAKNLCRIAMDGGDLGYSGSIFWDPERDFSGSLPFSQGEIILKGLK
jgi:hypothetical protein